MTGRVVLFPLAVFMAVTSLPVMFVFSPIIWWIEKNKHLFIRREP
jgi:hypothetical protein